jgi:hypothetical protein
VSTNRLLDHSKDLLNALTTYRATSSTSGRPIIFVVHSLGSLFLHRYALAVMQPSGATPLLMSSRTQQLSGTPYSGSALANWARIPASSLGIVTSINTSLLSVLDTRSKVLSRIQEDLFSMLRGPNKQADQFTPPAFARLCQCLSLARLCYKSLWHFLGIMQYNCMQIIGISFVTKDRTSTTSHSYSESFNDGCSEHHKHRGLRHQLQKEV